MDRVGAAYEIRELGRKEFEKELLKKVEEEASGLTKTRNKQELVEELADVLDVVEEIKKVKKIKPEEIIKAKKDNAKSKGGFKKRIYLVWSEDTGYKTNEKRNRG